MYKLNVLDKLSFIFIIIGAINWGLIGLFNLNIVGLVFSEPVNLIGRIVYILIGISGIDMVLFLFKMRKSFKE
ncbi:DUF378 domain-containing protein [Clostridium fermenticellae]|uniref:DUF378 domain-containing protein n=1 Tax=Clostridium fermenticellae TaxID=2068654 RepID=A0A386H333_9CLOT|nr:DUF378 domain-containing protein [Clostridium fermenticellae]AYD40090.1 DUF378 domain-containing protein [Clostridium fermenticellae]